MASLPIAMGTLWGRIRPFRWWIVLGLVGLFAALVAWLCSDECSFTTGAVFDISGGRATY